MLRLNKIYLLIAWGISCFLFYGVATHADETDQATKLTFSQPIQVPGRTLPAGTYLFTRDRDDENVVRIFNADGTIFYASALTIPTERPEPTGVTVITLANQGQDSPEVLLKWFYPGRLTGHEFIYPKQEEEQLDRAEQQNILAKWHAESGD